MAHVIEVPDDLYDRLAAHAEQRQQTPEQLFLSWARQVTTSRKETWGDMPPPTEEELAASPFLRMSGSLSIGDPRLATNLDEVLAEAIADDQGGLR